MIDQKQFRAVILITVAVLGSAGLVWGIAQLTNTTTRVELVNDGECPRALLQLIPRGGGGTFTLVAEPGQSESIEVVADLDYDYVMTTESPDVDGTNSDDPFLTRVCFDRDQGVINVPEGATFTYRVESVTRPFVVFELDEACAAGTINISARNDEREPILIEPGEEVEVELAPDRAYTYSVELVRLADADANICSGIDGAQITLSMGESDTINIEPDTE